MSELQAFELVVNAPGLTLDQSVALIAKCVRPPVDVGEVLDRLDSLADQFRGAGFDELRSALFGPLGFRGNTDDYGDPENSMIDAVLQRKCGIPITLAIVMIEVGRRLAVDIAPIGMPGHFLVQDVDSGTLCDPFHGGVALTVEDCRRMHDGVFRGRRPFDLGDLRPVRSEVVLARVLNNLEQSRLGTDRRTLATLLHLHRVIPSLPPHEYFAIASRFDAIGHYPSAGSAAQLAVDALVRSDASAETVAAAQRVMLQYWARSN